MTLGFGAFDVILINGDKVNSVHPREGLGGDFHCVGLEKVEAAFLSLMMGDKREAYFRPSISVILYSITPRVSVLSASLLISWKIPGEAGVMSTAPLFTHNNKG